MSFSSHTNRTYFHTRGCVHQASHWKGGLDNSHICIWSVCDPDQEQASSCSKESLLARCQLTHSSKMSILSWKIINNKQTGSGAFFILKKFSPLQKLLFCRLWKNYFTIEWWLLLYQFHFKKFWDDYKRANYFLNEKEHSCDTAKQYACFGNDYAVR